MSLKASQWAWEQRVGTGSAKAVLLVMCDKANKKTGKIFLNAETIAYLAEVHENSVWAYWERWTKRGLLIDTGERGGKNGKTPVFIWGGFRAGGDGGLPHTDHSLTTHLPQTNHTLTTASVVSPIGESAPNLKPITDNLNDNDKALGSSLAAEQPSRESSSSFFSNLEEASKDPRWKIFSTYCYSRPNGSPNLKGFNTWLKSPASKRSIKRSGGPGFRAEKRETREPSDEEFARAGQIANDAMAELKTKLGYG